jgi:PqqD family protein of HPr-rel-A system
MAVSVEHASSGKRVIRYRAAPAGTLRLVPLDVLTLVYHRSSGITHIVDAPVPEILEELAAPLEVAELLARLSAKYDIADADPSALTIRLEELVAAGLVERL